VEATDLGTFENTGQLRLHYRGTLVGELSMQFLHDGRPPVERCATLPTVSDQPASGPAPSGETWAADALKAILAAPSVRSKEEVIRRYDHEVQGGSVIKPLVGAREEGPSDAAVLAPVLGSTRGLALACGLNPRYGLIDPYAMAMLAIDEAVRNVVAVGGDPRRTALLDNFCWGNTNDPPTLGALVRACEACHDVAVAWGMPFISGKDSLHNEYRAGDRHIAIPGTLLISALALVDDVRCCVSMDLKAPGNRLYLVGTTRDELGGSHYLEVTGRSGGTAPKVDMSHAPLLFRAMHAAIAGGLVRAAHDLSEGGLAVAVAEMAFAGDVGADLNLAPLHDLTDEARLFSESATRWLVEVEPAKVEAFEAVLAGLPHCPVGTTVKEKRLRIAGGTGDWLVWATLAELKAAWQTPLGL
jgi:phosphoribosylformylglycinamidine synthase